jgi:branched-chain amino acid transport system ATP-binding protein
MNDESAALVLDKVTKDFGGLRAADEVSLQIEPGERRAIIGPNGAGKTTLFNLITGEIPVTSGRIHLYGRDITSMPPHARTGAGLGRTYQITNIFPGLTVAENVQLAAQGLSGIKFSFFGSIPKKGHIHGKVEQALEKLHLTSVKDVKASELSYGEQRQLEIALALAGEPRVLLLDEPAAGLSAAERVTIANLVRSLPADLTVVLIEHDMDLALGLVDKVAVLHFGKIIVEDTPANIRGNETVQEIYLGDAV